MTITLAYNPDLLHLSVSGCSIFTDIINFYLDVGNTTYSCLDGVFGNLNCVLSNTIPTHNYTMQSTSDFYYDRMIQNYSLFLNNSITNTINTLPSVNSYVFKPFIPLYYTKIQIIIALISYLSQLAAIFHNIIFNILIEALFFFYYILIFFISLGLKHKALSFVLLFMSLIQSGFATNLNQKLLETVIAPTGFVSHIAMGYIFDLFSFKLTSKGHIVKYKKSKYIIHHKLLSRFILGLIYTIYIGIAVLFSDSIWFFLKSLPRLLLFLLSSIVSITFPIFWLKLAEIAVNNYIRIIFRALIENLSFTSCAISAYCLWEFLPTNTDIFNIIWALVAVPIHLLSSAFAIFFECKGQSSLWYGLSYYFSFMSASTSTSGIFTLYDMHVNSGFIHSIVVAFSVCVVIGLFPDFYRKDLKFNKEGRRSLTWMVLGYYVLYLSFVFFTGIIKLYMFPT